MGPMNALNDGMAKQVAVTRSVLFGLLLVPFFANDVLFHFMTTPAAIYGVDYVIRVVVIGAFVLSPPPRSLAVESLRWRSKYLWGVVLAVVVAVVIWAESPTVDYVFQRWTGWWRYAGYPALDMGALKVFDLTVGLLLVAVSEELVCRALACDVFRRLTTNRALVAMLSSLLFGLVHWGGGLGGVASGAVAGLLLTGLYFASGSLVPAIAAHYAVDLILFW